MITTLLFVISLILAYLLGSVPASVWIGRSLYDIDVREHGSKGTGATNTFRVLGTKTGIFVMLIDILKGWLAANIPYLVTIYQVNTKEFMTIQLILGIVAIIGHVFPVFIKFKGGKGVATLFGVILAILPHIAIICAGVFLLILILSRYVSLSSIIASICLPVLIILIYNIPNIPIRIFSVFITLIVLFTHHNNIKRLFNKEENKTYLFRQKK